MTFQDLFDQLQKLTPEQRQQEVMFIKLGAHSSENYYGLAEEHYYENTDRVQLSVDSDGVWYADTEYADGIAFGLSKEEQDELGEDKTELVPAGMPFFAILSEKNDPLANLVKLS